MVSSLPAGAGYVSEKGYSDTTEILFVPDHGIQRPYQQHSQERSKAQRQRTLDGNLLGAGPRLP